jgi:molybdate transport system regulatory protein
MPKVIIRIALSSSSAIGPGKIRLLEHVDETGSISAAARAMDMSYRRAWLLIDELNSIFKQRVTVAEHGGRAGGGAKLTAFGRDLVRHYREMETDAHVALSTHLATLEAAMQRRSPRSGTRRAAAE